jgi:hypothetical protein
MKEILTCAARPCASCPYRKDAPSGLWSQDEYDKLPIYDGEITDQVFKGAFAVFMCHQKDGTLCAGWVAAHGPHELLALRVAGMHGERIDESVWDYKTDIPVFSSGAEAREHGMRDMANPGSKARKLMGKFLEKGIGNIGDDDEDLDTMARTRRRR